MQKNFYRRNLPHWHPVNQSFFLTWRLEGSLPSHVIKELRASRQQLRRKCDLTSDARALEHKRLFAKVDRILDNAQSGPLWLAVPQIAHMIQATLLERYAHMYKLWSYVVMANHVHVFLKPKPVATVELITKHLKGYTAREANRILGRTGQTFWQDECFDHWPRDEDEFFRIANYVENNPVKAGLVPTPEDWVRSSAAERRRRKWKRFRELT